MTPGLSVIIDAIKESRRIFQRMNSYAIYRIAETLRVLFFMTLAILIFNFYPLTAVMIVMLALLNDGAILSIAYDNVVLSKERPREIRYRSADPILTPMLALERSGTVANVVFPTGIDRRDDLGSPDRFDVYYGMADNRIGVARLDLPDSLPSGGVAAQPKGKV